MPGIDISPGPLPLTNPFQKYVVGASPINTRRSTLVLGGDGDSGLQTVADHAWRAGFTLPVTPTRYRFKIANNNCLTNVRNPGVINVSGIWIGKPNVGAEAAWQGDFTVTPKQVVGAVTVDPAANGTEYVSPWITNGGEIVINQFQGFSIGATTAVQLEGGVSPGLRWATAGSAASAGTAAVPTGALSIYSPLLDIRMEYEFVGSNQIGLFIGTSITNGVKSAQVFTANIPIGHMGPDDAYPIMSGMRNGFCNINGGIGGVQTATWVNTAGLCWTRFDLTTCTPDYAVIDLGINDAAVGLLPLATFQANIRTIIAYLQSLGIYKILICTQSTITNVSVFSSPAGVGMQLQAAKASGAIGTLVGVGNQITAPYGGAALGGPPGNANAWYQGAGGPWACYVELPTSNIFEGPFTITNSALAAGVMTLTVTGSLVNNHELGAPVITQAEGLRQIYNNWIRSLAPGANMIVDMARISEWDFCFPPYIGNPRYYGNSGDVHPANAGFYGDVAADIVNSLVGV